MAAMRTAARTTTATMMGMVMSAGFTVEQKTIKNNHYLQKKIQADNNPVYKVRI